MHPGHKIALATKRGGELHPERVVAISAQDNLCADFLKLEQFSSCMAKYSLLLGEAGSSILRAIRKGKISETTPPSSSGTSHKTRPMPNGEDHSARFWPPTLFPAIRVVNRASPAIGTPIQVGRWAAS
jgi:hypothetical protein